MMTFNKTEEAFDFVAKIKPEVGNAENSVASAIRILAWVTIIGGLILGFFLGKGPYDNEFSFTIAVIYWAVSIVTGIMLMGFSEIIRLLQQNAEKEYKIYCKKLDISQSLCETKVKNAAQVLDGSNIKNTAEQNVPSFNQAEKEVHFATRPADTLVCPLCNSKQYANRSVCFDCGARFIFDDEK